MDAKQTQTMRSQAGMTLLEVMVAFMILTSCAVPLVISLGDAHRRVADGQVKRTLKQLMEYKLAHVLLDRPGDDQEPIYVDGAEGNFGDEFDSEENKTYGHDERLYYYSYRISSEEVDLGSEGGITGEEEEFENESTEPESSDPGGSPFGGLGGEEQQEEEQGQLRYRVTLTVFYRTGNANYDQHMSVVTYVRHPHHSEAMSGPDLDPSQSNMGSGESNVGNNAEIGNGLTGNKNGSGNSSTIKRVSGNSADLLRSMDQGR